MDIRVIYTIVSVNNCSLHCKCTEHYSYYFYISDIKLPFKRPGDIKYRQYYRGYCTNCNKTIIIYDTDKLTKIDKLVWITV